MKSLFTKFFLVFFVLLVPRAEAADSQAATLSSGGLDRTYNIYRPASLNRGTPSPLVIMMHGGFGTGAQAEHSYNWDAEADKKGFVVAYPDGIDHSWNAGGTCCGHAARDNVDDIAFLSSLIQTLVKAENIDPTRVYLTGMSNGAAMSYRYACEGSYPIAAIGPVSGSLSYACPKPRAISVMEIHGKDDQNIPYAGGVGSRGISKVSWLGVPETLDLFRLANNCALPAVQQNGTVRVMTSKCSDGHKVTLITLEGAGHQWPGGQSKSIIQRLMGLDPPSQDLDATETLWSFFEGQRGKN